MPDQRFCYCIQPSGTNDLGLCSRCGLPGDPIAAVEAAANLIDLAAPGSGDTLRKFVKAFQAVMIDEIERFLVEGTGNANGPHRVGILGSLTS